MATTLPELPDDVLRTVLLLLATGDDPTCLASFSLTNKNDCYRIVAGPDFRHLLRQLPPMPWILGLLYTEKRGSTSASRFVVNNPDFFLPAARDRDLPGRRVLDSRHGRVLLLTPGANLSAELWNPLTNESRPLPLPPLPMSPRLTAGSNITNCINAAVLCSAAAGACNHRNCHGGHFRVALVYLKAGVMYVREYSSETGDWSQPVSAPRPAGPYRVLLMPYHPSTLVGDTLYFRCELGYVLEYRLGGNNLSFIEGPPYSGAYRDPWALSLMPKDGRLGCMYVEDDESGLRLRQWSREAADGVAQWTKGRAIDVKKLLPDAPPQCLQLAPASSYRRYRRRKLQLLGSAEATDVIFLGTWFRGQPDAVYMVELDSERATKVFDGSAVVVPYTSYRIPVPAPVSSA